MLEEKTKIKEKLEKRLNSIKGLQRGIEEKGTSNILLKFLQSVRDELAKYFHDKELDEKAPQRAKGAPRSARLELVQWQAARNASAYVIAMEEAERDADHLQMVEDMIQEVVQGKYGPAHAENSVGVGKLLEDLVELHRSWGRFVLGKWTQEDLDLSCFLEDPKARRPCFPSSALQQASAGEQPRANGYVSPPALSGKGSGR